MLEKKENERKKGAGEMGQELGRGGLNLGTEGSAAQAEAMRTKKNQPGFSESSRNVLTIKK